MKIKNVSGEDLLVPWLGGRLVSKGQVVEVREDEVYAFTQQTNWEPADDEAQAAHDEGQERYAPLAEALTEPPERPAGNATRDEWAAYAVAAGYVPDLAALDGIGRDEIRDTYTTEGVS